jgi:hypothetical protein
MPTYENPAADASEAAEALRGLAHAGRVITDPNDTYQVLGALSGALMSLRQSLDQLADWHDRNAGYAATDDGDRDAGRRDATAASDYLRDAADRIQHAHRSLSEAFNHNGRIAWQDQGLDAIPAQPGSGHPRTRQGLAPPSVFGTDTTPQERPHPLGR